MWHSCGTLGLRAPYDYMHPMLHAPCGYMHMHINQASRLEHAAQLAQAHRIKVELLLALHCGLAQPARRRSGAGAAADAELEGVRGSAEQQETARTRAHGDPRSCQEGARKLPVRRSQMTPTQSTVVPIAVVPISNT